MKILIVSELSVPYAIGGGEVRYGLLTRELARLGHDVTWLSMRQRQSPDEEIIDGVRHLHRGPRIESPPRRPLFAMLRYMFTAFWYVLTHRYDIVDCQPYAPLPAVWLACVLSRQRMVATIHDTSSRPAAATPGQPVQPVADDQWLSARDRLIVGPVETLLYRLPYRRIVTDTHGVRQTLARSFGVSDRRMVTVHCGIDTLAIAAAPAAASQVDVLFAGRVIPHKHVDDFLDAVAIVGKSRLARGLPSLRAAVVGDGPLLEEMRAHAGRLGLEPALGRGLGRGLGPATAVDPPAATVEFCGSLSEHATVIGRMKSAGVLVLPSTREGFGLVLAEACACGTPCVAYDVPAVREVLADGEAGMLVAPRDVAALAAAIDRVLTDSAERGRLIAAGRRQVAACFSADSFAGNMISAYES
jgi:glycosyltransferase involved in cell wall biosynthesis